MRRIVIATALGLLLGVVSTACGGDDSGTGDETRPAVVGTDRAQATAKNMLVAYNSRDYQAFSRDWSPAARLLVGQRSFREFRDENLPVTGPFKAITGVTPVAGRQDAGHASYRVHATFQKRQGVVFTITLSADGTKVEGLELHARS